LKGTPFDTKNIATLVVYPANWLTD